jgi:GntR family transcriptional regulator
VAAATSPIVPDRANPLPLWAQVLADLRRRLTAGEFDDAFPPERELIEEYGVSRHTVRDAIRRLHQAGVINRERGRGTFLRQATIEQPTGALYSLFQSIESQGFTQHSLVLALDVVNDTEAATHLGLAPTAKLVHLSRVRHADGVPIAVDELWLPHTIARPLLGVDFTHTALYAELEARCGLRPGGGWERVHPVVPAAHERALLRLPARQAAFLVERYTEAKGAALEWRRTIIRGDQYSFLTTWSSTGEVNGATVVSPTQRRIG